MVQRSFGGAYLRKLQVGDMSSVQNPVDIPLYWLVDRDP